jgi:hypothetical protein
MIERSSWTEFQVLAAGWRDPAGNGALSNDGIERHGFLINVQAGCSM